MKKSVLLRFDFPKNTLSSAFFVALLAVSSFLASQTAGIDTLKHIIKNSPEDTNKVKLLNDLSKRYRQQGHYDSALKYITQSLDLIKRIPPSHKTILNILAGTYNTYGILCKEMGNYPEALKNYFLSLQVFSRTGNKRGMANAYNSIGNAYYKQANLDEALKNFLQAFRLRLEIDDKSGLAVAYNNIGMIQNDKLNYKEALKNYTASIKLKEELGDKQGLADSYNNMANVYMEQRNFQEALKIHFKALEVRKELNNKNGIAISFLNICEIFNEQDKFADAKKYALEGLRLSREVGNLNNIEIAYEHCSAVYANEKKYKEALAYYKLFIGARDSLFNESNTKKTVQLAMNYEFEKKEAAARLEQEKKDFISAEDKRKQKIILWYVVAGFGLVIVVALFIFRSLRINQKKNRIIMAQKEMVEKQKHIVEEKQKEILDSIHYARRIQRSLLTHESYIQRQLARLIK